MAEPGVIEEAYKRLAKEYDPDSNNDPSAAETMSKIDFAYSVVKDPSLRELYHQEWLERKLYPSEYIPKDKVDDVPKYRAEYVPKVKDNGIPKYKAEYIPKVNDFDVPKYKDETVGHRAVNSRRIAIIILLVADLALVSVFILAPFISLFVTQNNWILYILSSLLGALVASLIFAAKFRHGLITLLKSAVNSTQKWITSESINKNVLDRFLVFVLIFMLIALIVYIYVIPWVIQVLVKRSPIEMVLLTISLLIIGILLTSRRFWQYCFHVFQSIRSTTAHYIPNNFNPAECHSNISERTWEPGEMKDVFSRNVWNEILNFRPSRQYDNEGGYHNELFNYLQNKFHQAQSNKRVGSSQPDIRIEHIAIEIKGPTGKNQLRDLSHKVIRYLAGGHHTLLFIVLFDPQKEISPAYFKDLKDGLLKIPKVGVITKRNY